MDVSPSSYKYPEIPNRRKYLHSIKGYEVAQMECLNADDPAQAKLLQAILQEMPFDFDWDETSPRERALRRSRRRSDTTMARESARKRRSLANKQ